jgi:F-type H+-transporting ATPase subunit epsilon
MVQNTQKFSFRLVSPEAELMAVDATTVTAPGTEGDFGVKPGHMALVSSLRPGVITIETPSEPGAVRYFISGGFANVTATSCTILAEQAIDVLQLNATTIANDIAMIEARLKTPQDDVTMATLRAELTLAQAKLKAAS